MSRYKEIKEIIRDKADNIQKLATQHHKEYLHKTTFRTEYWEKYQKGHILILKKISSNFTQDVKKGSKVFWHLGDAIAKTAIKDGLTIEESVDGIIFLKQAIWQVLKEEKILDTLSSDEYYTCNQIIGTYCDVIASRIAFVYHDIYEKNIAKFTKEKKKSEEAVFRLAAIVRSSDDAIISKNLQGLITSWNRAAEDLYGYSAKEAMGKHISFLIPKELHKEEDEILRKIRKGIKIEHFETVRIRKDGTRFLVSLSISPVKDSEGKIIGAAKIARNITEKKKNEEQLQYLGTLAQSIRDAVITTDAEYRITNWNKGAEEMYGWKEEEVLGKLGREILDTEFSKPSHNEKPWQKSLAEKGYWVGEVSQKRKDGTRISVLASVAIVKNTYGKIIGGVGVNRDITERKQAEQNLRFLSESSKILSSSLDYTATLKEVVTLAVPQIGDWCAVDIVNEKHELDQLAIAHKDPKKVKWAKEYRKLNPRDLSASTGIALAINTQKSLLYPIITDEMLVASAKNAKELELARKLNIVSAMIVPIISNKQAIGGISFITSDTKRQYTKTDVTVVEELASRIALAIENARLFQQARKELEQRKRLEKQKDEFIGVASHELKTPVTSIKSFTQVLRLRFVKEGNQRAAELLGKMDAQVDKLTNLIGDLLDVTKIEAGKMLFTQEYFAFDELVQELIEELQRTTERHVIIKDGNTGKIVFGDRERIGQVITNLVSNAIKYSPYAKEIIVHISVEEKFVKLCVQDFGIGIEKSKQDKVFERFFRASGPGKETYPGLGLGLYVSNEIIKRMHGRLWVDSIEGKGSTFCFIIPLKAKKEKLNIQNNSFTNEAIKHE